MKRLAFLTLAVIISLGAIAQQKYQPKVVVLFMGEKNPTFDESKFPDCKFYYTPGITAEVKEAKSVSNKLLSRSGIKKEGGVYDIKFGGAPAEAYSTNIIGGTFFDKNGLICGQYKTIDNILVSPKKNLQGAMDFVSYKSFSKDYIKKGKTIKKAKRAPKKPKKLFDYHRMEMPTDFEVVDSKGNKENIKNLVKGEPLTLLYVLYLKSDYDLKAGTESGENKKGKQFINDALNTTAAIKKLEKVSEIEQDIFGHKVVW